MRERIAQVLQPFADGNEVRRLARHLAAVMQGISIQARDGANPTELQEIIEDVLSGLEARFPGDAQTTSDIRSRALGLIPRRVSARAHRQTFNSTKRRLKNRLSTSFWASSRAR